MNKKVISGLTLAAALAGSLWGGELDEYKIIESAYEDQLYLFVEDKARAFLSNDEYHLKVSEVRAFLIAGLLEREAYDQALNEIKAMGELKGPRWTYLKARALFGAKVETGKSLNGEKRPSELLKNVLPFLKGEDQLMGRYVMGQDLFEAGDYINAHLTLKPLVEGDKRFRYREDAKFLYGRALFYYSPEGGRYEDALYTFRELAQKYTTSPLLSRYHFWQAQCFFEVNLLDEAESSFNAALAANPDDGTIVDVNYNLGWLYAAMGDLDRASKSLREVMKAQGGYAERYIPSACYKLGSILMLQKKPKECIEVLKPILVDANLASEANLLSAQAAVNLEDFKLAEGFLRDAQKKSMNRKEILLEAGRMMGRIQLKLKNFDEAEDTLKRLLDQKEVPLDFRIEIQLQLAEVYTEKNDVYRSQEIYQQLLAEKNRKIEAELHYFLALCAMEANPLLEGIYLRDQLHKELSELPANVLEERKKIIEAKIGAELSNYWELASNLGIKSTDPESEKKRIFNELLTYTTLNKAALIKLMGERVLEYNEKRGPDNKIVFNEQDHLATSLSDFITIAKAVRKYTVLKQLESMTGENLATLIENKNKEYEEKTGKQLSATGMDTIMFNDLVKVFKEKLWSEDQNRVAPYVDLDLGIFSRSSKYLQYKTIENHLNHVINMGERSQYLAMAYAEKAKLLRERGNSSDAIESFLHAIANATSFESRADYLLQITRIEIELAKSMTEPVPGQDGAVSDPKTIKFKLNQALKHLEQAEEILKERPLKLADLLFTAHRLLLNNDKAEEVLLQFLEVGGTFDEIQAVEEKLIAFYLQRGRPVMAAQRRLVYAETLDNYGQFVEAQRQRFEAATALVGSKQGHKEGVERLLELYKSEPPSEWTFKAGLARVGILQRAQKTEEAEELLTQLEKDSKNGKPALRLEVQMARGNLALILGDQPKAEEAFRRVIEQAGYDKTFQFIKAKAMIEYSKTMERRNPEKAAEVYLEFYYLFPNDSNREMTLYESCRLKIRALKSKEMEPKALTARRTEILRLINKLKQPRDRQKLSAYLQGS